MPEPVLGRVRRRSSRSVPVAVWLCLGYLIALLLAAAVVPPLFGLDPLKQDLTNTLAFPSAAHPLGTDDLGRDIAVRLLAGSVPSMLAAGMAVAIGLILGGVLGFLPALLPRWADAVAARITDVLLAFPPIILALAITGVAGINLVNAMLAVGVVFAPIVARLAVDQRSLVANSKYVEAARMAGASEAWILFRHVIPNSARPLVIQAASLFAVAILAEAALSFIGVGTQPPDPSWGSMLGRGFRYLRGWPLQSIAPGVLIAVTVLVVNTLSNALSSGRRR